MHRIRIVSLVSTALAATAFACGETLTSEVDTPAPTRDSGADSVVVEDARADAADATIDAPAIPSCDLDRPFGQPIPLPELSSSAEEASPHLTDDELEIVFQSRRPEGGGLPRFYVAHRTSRSAPFDTPQQFPIYQEGDTDPVYSGNGLSLYFSSTVRAGSQSYDIWATERSSLAGNWGVPFRQIGLSTTDPEFQPSLRAGGLWYTRLANASDRSIWFAKLTNGAFEAGNKVLGLDQDGVDDELPTPSADGLSIYFASRRKSASDLDIWFARRSNKDEEFAAPIAVAELNTSADDVPSWLSIDGCRLYFVRPVLRDGAIDLDIHFAEKPPK
jgi:hypothetical protein